jgi:hypothetical protein
MIIVTIGKITNFLLKILIGKDQKLKLFKIMQETNWYLQRKSH